MIRKVECGHTQYLQESDVILSINGKIITRVSELDVMYDHDVLDVVVVRKCEEIRLQVPTVPTEDLETNRAVIFCGAILHRPHHAVRQQISVLHSEVYVSARVSSPLSHNFYHILIFGQTRGSPAYQYALVPTNFILAVNGVPTLDLDSFLKEVSKIPDNTCEF
jgi:pro-apoptotic serine protease NMA111